MIRNSNPGFRIDLDRGIRDHHGQLLNCVRRTQSWDLKASCSTLRATLSCFRYTFEMSPYWYMKNWIFMCGTWSLHHMDKCKKNCRFITMCKFRCDTYKTAKICFHYMFSFHFQCFDVLSVVYSLSLSVYLFHCATISWWIKLLIITSRAGDMIHSLLYPRPVRWWKLFLLFYTCHFTTGLTHCYKTTDFLHLYLQFF